MDKYRLKLRNIANVAASSTALIELPIGPRYHTVLLEHGFGGGTNTIAGAASNVSEVRIKVNGRVQRVFSGTQLRDLNLLNGTAYDIQGGPTPNTIPVQIPIYFAEPWRKDAQDQDRLAWETSGWDAFSIEVDLAAGTAPTLTALAVVDGFVSGVSPAQRKIAKILRTQIAAAGTSLDFSQLDRRDWLQQISLYAGTGGTAADYYSLVTLRRNGQILHEVTKSLNKALLLNNGMTPAASGRTSNLYDLVLDHDDLLGSAVNLEGSRDLTLSIESASAMSGNIVALIQRIGTLE